MYSDPSSWIKEYSSQRYLRKASRDQLLERLDQLANNSWTADDMGIVRPPHPHNRMQIAKLTIHALMEQKIRRGEASISFDENAIRCRASSRFKRPDLNRSFVRPSNCISKFGKKRWIREAYENGSIKVSPASDFNDFSFNPAQRDDELTHWTRTPNRHLLLRMYGQDTDGNQIELPYNPQELFEGISVTDFYVWCCTLGYHHRIFGDFDYDAVLVIHNIEEFRRRFAVSLSALVPNGELIDRVIEYYDPYTTPLDRLIPIFSKNFQYLYQNEYRFAWKVSAGSKMATVFPKLGPMHDIAEYYELN